MLMRGKRNPSVQRFCGSTRWRDKIGVSDGLQDNSRYRRVSVAGYTSLLRPANPETPTMPIDEEFNEDRERARQRCARGLLRTLPASVSVWGAEMDPATALMAYLGSRGVSTTLRANIDDGRVANCCR